MMKPLYLYFFSPIFFVALAFTGRTQTGMQAQDTTYFDNADKPTTPQLASYYQIMVHTDSGWTFFDHWMNGRLKITGAISEDMKRPVGTFTYYDTTGMVTMRRKYVGHGGAIETQYYPDGHIMLEGPTLEQHKMGDWTAYYPSGKIKAVGSYSIDQLDTASFFNEDGSANDSRKVFWRDAEYPGGTEAWLQFLNKNLHYPDDAVNNGLQGTVAVRFKISKEGSTSDFTIIQSAGKSLNEEAIRVIKKSGDWLPAIHGGIAEDTYKIQPVGFRIGNLQSLGSADEDYDKTFTKVEIEPAFPGGDQAWRRYLRFHLNYRDLDDAAMPCTVTVQFIVDVQGNVSNVQAVDGPISGGFREEAVRAVKRSGKWTPAIQNGRQVKSYVKVPVTFEPSR